MIAEEGETGIVVPRSRRGDRWARWPIVGSGKEASICCVDDAVRTCQRFEETGSGGSSDLGPTDFGLLSQFGKSYFSPMVMRSGDLGQSIIRTAPTIPMLKSKLFLCSTPATTNPPTPFDSVAAQVSL